MKPELLADHCGRAIAELEEVQKQAAAGNSKAAAQAFRRSERIVAYVDSHIQADTAELVGYDNFRPRPFR